MENFLKICKQVYLLLFILLMCCTNAVKSENIIECLETQQSKNYPNAHCTFKNISIVPNSDSQDDGKMEFRPYNYVRSVIFINSTIHEVPRSMFQRIPNINNLTMRGVGLADELNRYTFEYGNNLIAINLGNNNITVVDKYAFTSTKSVETIDLSWNQISKIDASAFSQCTKLRNLKMAHNLVQRLPVDVFQSLNEVNSIDFSSNQLLELHKDTFGKCKSLKTLRLASNNLVKLELNLPLSISTIDIGHNRLRECYIDAVQNPSKVLNLFKDDLRIGATNNSLSNFDVHPNFALSHMDLSRNLMNNISNISKIVTIKNLNLSFNPIRSIPINCFNGMTDLVYLYLQHISLEKIEYGIFSRNIRLKHLDLSHNNLSEIDLNMFVALSSLEELSLVGNQLTTFDYTALLEVFPKIRYIAIANNNWTCKTLAKILRYLNIQRIQLLDDRNVYVQTNEPNLKSINCRITADDISQASSVQPISSKNANENDVIEFMETKNRLFKMNMNKQEEKSNMIPTYYEKVTQQDMNASADIEAIKIMVFILLLINVVFFGIKLGRYIKTKKSSRSIRLSGGIKDENFMDDLVS